jgi:hypothetical protein
MIYYFVLFTSGQPGFMIRGIWITGEVTAGIMKGDLSFAHHSADNIKHAPGQMLKEPSYRLSPSVAAIHK